MAVRTGVLSSATPALALYNLIAADLTANPNWARPPANPTLTGVTDSYSATYTSEVWKCTVGASTFVVVFSTDTANPNNLRITFAEKYDAADGCGAKRFRRIPGGGAAGTVIDTSSVTPGATDVVTDTDTALISTNPNFCFTQLVLTGSAFSYMYKVTNKTVTIGVVVTNNKWVHVGAFESLVTGPPDPVPIGMFTHGVNNVVNINGTISTGSHGDGVVTRHPGIGTTTESGAFFAVLSPLHAPAGVLYAGSGPSGTTGDFLGYGGTIPRWYTKPLMSQAVIHQSRGANSVTGRAFRGYYADLFATISNTATEPSGGGVDSVVIDGVTYYWLGANCPGATATAVTAGLTSFIAIRAD